MIQISSDIHGNGGSGNDKSHFDFDENTDNQGDIASDIKELEEMIEEISAMSEESREFALGELIKALGDNTELISFVQMVKKYVEMKDADKIDETATATSVSDKCEVGSGIISRDLLCAISNITKQPRPAPISETVKDEELDLDFEKETGDDAAEELNQPPSAPVDGSDSETDIDGELELDFDHDQNAGDDDFDFEIFDDEEEDSSGSNVGTDTVASNEMDEEQIQQALHETMKRYYTMPKAERQDAFAKVIQMLGDDTKLINELKQLMKEYDEKEQSAEPQASNANVDEPDDDFKQAMQEAIEEFLIMSEDEREDRFAEIIESLSGNEEAIAYVKHVMDVVRNMKEFLEMTEQEREDRFAEIIDSLGDDTEAIKYVQSVMEAVRNKKISMESLVSLNAIFQKHVPV